MPNTKKESFLTAAEAYEMTNRAIANTDADWLANARADIEARIKVAAKAKQVYVLWTYAEDGTRRLLLLTNFLVDKGYAVSTPRYFTPRATMVTVSWDQSGKGVQDTNFTVAGTTDQANAS